MPSALKMPDIGGTTTRGNAELPRQIGRMHAAIASERHQREIARIAAAFDGDRADRARHRGIGDRADAMGGVLQRQP